MANLKDWMKFHLKVNINLVKKLLPDIVIATASNNQRDIFRTTVHELSHASHFRQVGAGYWREYVRYILDCWNNGLSTYGSRLEANHGRCGVGEIWGFFSGRWFSQYYYGPHSTTYPNNNEMNYWFKPQILWDIATNEILTTNEIFQCLTPDVTTIEQLREKMKAKYPSKAKAIENIFNKYYTLALIDIDVPVVLG